MLCGDLFECFVSRLDRLFYHLIRDSRRDKSCLERGVVLPDRLLDKEVQKYKIFSSIDSIILKKGRGK